MHRHGYRGRKFARKTDERRALIKGLASNLSLQESIETTLPKAKELVPYFEKLITKSKKGDLHNRRIVISKMANIESAHKLIDEIAPKLTERSSGHLKIIKTKLRKGDNTQMARVTFVDDLVKVKQPKLDKSKSPKEKIDKKKPTGGKAKSVVREKTNSNKKVKTNSKKENTNENL